MVDHRLKQNTAVYFIKIYHTDISL